MIKYDVMSKSGKIGITQISDYPTALKLFNELQDFYPEWSKNEHVAVIDPDTKQYQILTDDEFLSIRLICSLSMNGYLYCNHDYLEDKDLENGQYQNKCPVCETIFIGHKRRKLCKRCKIEKK